MDCSIYNSYRVGDLIVTMGIGSFVFATFTHNIAALIRVQAIVRFRILIGPCSYGIAIIGTGLMSEYMGSQSDSLSLAQLQRDPKYRGLRMILIRVLLIALLSLHYNIHLTY